MHTFPHFALFDVHAHMADPAFDPDRRLVLERAGAAGVVAVVTVGEGFEDSLRGLELAAAAGASVPFQGIEDGGREPRAPTGPGPSLLPGAGLAPSAADPVEAERVASLARREVKRLRCVGEVGLDFWVAKDSRARDLQREVFAFFIDLALELDLPLNVHSRSAGRQTIDLLLRKGVKKAQLHAFDGKASSALPAVEAGYFFSVPPSVARSEQKQKLVRALPLRALLIETDSPVLGPTREERNEPANALRALECVARLKGVPTADAAAAAARNALELYGAAAGLEKK